jgi:hypothetical protein
MNYLYGSIAILIALLGVEQYGEHRVEVRWDLEKARLQALADQTKRQDKEITAILESQHLKDIQNAKSEAGKRAIADYLKSHGLLHAEGNCSQAQSTGGITNSTCECGVSVEVESLAARCGEDALKILRFQEWIQREGLETQ